MKLKTKFQDEDFDLGEVVDGVIVECIGKHEKELRVIATAAKGGQHTFYYSSIKKFIDDWEDYEEPEEFWYINECGDAIKYKYDGGCSSPILEAKEIGNHFDTEEQAEKAVEKLKALKRLKDKGMIKYSFHKEKTGIDLDYYTLTILAPRDKDSLDLLFGGEDGN